MITIKYKGEIVDPKDIEITWVEYDCHSKDGLVEKTGDIEDFGFSKYSEGYDEGYNEGTYKNKDMDYTDLKNGDIVVMTYNEYPESRIIIVNKVEQSYTGIYKLYTYAELDIEYSDIFVEKDEPGYSYDVNDCIFRPAEKEEKIRLYNALGKFFTEEYDEDWYKHFTDSSYFDIIDYLLDVFCIKMGENGEYPDFLDDIRRHIWCKCCDAVGMPDGFSEEPEEQMVSLEKVKAWLKENMYECDSDEKWVNTYFHTMEEMFNDLEKIIK